MNDDDELTAESLSTFAALALGALLVPFLGIVVGSVDVAVGSRRRVSRGLWLLLLGLVPIAILLAFRFS